MDHWIDAYHGEGFLNQYNRKTTLFGIFECARPYYRDSDDPRLLEVLLHASRHAQALDHQPNSLPTDAEGRYQGTGSTRQLIRDVFMRYGCLQQARDRPGHARLMSSITPRAQCTSVSVTDP